MLVKCAHGSNNYRRPRKENKIMLCSQPCFCWRPFAIIELKRTFAVIVITQTRPRLFISITGEYGCQMPKIWVNIGPSNGLESDNTKTLPEPMLTLHQQGPDIYRMASSQEITHQSITKSSLQIRVTWGKTPTLRIHAHILITNGWNSLKLIHNQIRL